MHAEPGWTSDKSNKVDSDMVSEPDDYEYQKEMDQKLMAGTIDDRLRFSRAD